MTDAQKLRQIVEAVRKTGAKPLQLTETDPERLRHIVEAVRTTKPATASLGGQQ
jgi:CO dehydrogenase/acetyl-CoA synthase gamma subunit (corrinoid Fe-S protein)